MLEEKLRTDFVENDYVAPYGTKLMHGKIAFEEHFESPTWQATDNPNNSISHNPSEYYKAMKERLYSADARIADMDRNGVDMFIMSLTQPGIQMITDPAEAVSIAHDMNLWVHENYVKKHPTRFNSFAAVALQDVDAAIEELEFCIKELGFCGCMVNGYTAKGSVDHIEYLDEPQFRPFWKKLAELDVPLYLHPRGPIESCRRPYEGYPGLALSAWGFGAETALHALRLMCSGLFDEVPNAKVVLGHLGESLPFTLPRVQHRLDQQNPCGAHKKPLPYYFDNNFYVTTSGHYHTRAFLFTLQECNVKHVMFSSDTPYESLDEAATWFDNVPLNATDRDLIGRQNAIDLLHLNI